MISLDPSARIYVAGHGGLVGLREGIATAHELFVAHRAVAAVEVGA